MSAVSFASITRTVGAKSTTIPWPSTGLFCAICGLHQLANMEGGARRGVLRRGVSLFRNVLPGMQVPIGPKRRAVENVARSDLKTAKESNLALYLKLGSKVIGGGGGASSKTTESAIILLKKWIAELNELLKEYANADRP